MIIESELIMKSKLKKQKSIIKARSDVEQEVVPEVHYLSYDGSRPSIL